MPLTLQRLLVFITVIGFVLAACGGHGEEEVVTVNEENGFNSPSENDPNTNTDPNQSNTSENDPSQNDPSENDPSENDPTENDPSENDPTENDPNQQNTNQTPSEPAIDGEACQSDDDCISGACLTGPEWPNGYCSTIHCETFEDCANDENDPNACLINPNGPNFCVRLCDPTTNEPCRDEYRCQQLSSGGEGWCAGDPDDGGTGDPAEIPFDITCEPVSGQYAEITYDIDEDTDSYMIVPITGNGDSLAPIDIATPGGQTIDFQGANSFQAVGAQLFGSVNPTVVPAAPQFSGQLQSGSHTYTLYTSDSEMCHYILEAPGNPNVIDLNIYLVGVPGLDASNAATSGDLQSILGVAETIYDQAGISFGDVRYYEVPSDVEQAYQNVTSEGDIRQLASHSVDPEEDGGSSLSANIFIVRQFGMGGVLGLSLGIPGVAGLHGTGISGVAMTGEHIGSSQGNQLTANILAHELGHFLGLFHTSEQNGQSFDPLEDTPQCTDFSNPTSCPDWGNLMFPSAHFQNTQLTNDQSFVLGVNPLTK